METPDKWSVSPTKLSQRPIANNMRWQCLQTDVLSKWEFRNVADKKIKE
jgi:hypothetical protein